MDLRGHVGLGGQRRAYPQTRAFEMYVNSSGGGLIFFRGRPLDKVRKVLAMPTLQVSWMQMTLAVKTIRKLSSVIGYPRQDVAAALPRGFEGFRCKVEKSRQGKRLMKTSKFEHCNITRQVLGPPTERQKQLADRAIRFGTHVNIIDRSRVAYIK